MYNKSIDVENYRKKEGVDLQTMLMIFDILGTVAFAASGALVAIKRRMDIFGVAVLAIVTATGGGILRDVLIGRLPPDALLYPRYVAIAAGVGLLCFLVMYFHPRMPEKLTTAYDMMMFIFDTLGVAAFTVDGVAVGKSSSFGGNWFLLVFLGVITGVGGGMIRDILASRVPEVLQKHVYALASIIGALITGIMTIYGIDEQISVICGFAAIVLLRILAARFRWNLPRVGKSSRNRKRSSKDIGIDDGDIQDDE